MFSHTNELLRQPERRRRLVALCATISGDRGAAEDLAQETLLEAWRNAHKVHDPEGLDRWLAAIARNVCRRWARRLARDSTPLTLLEDRTAPDPLAELERSELLELLGRALGELPAETRDVLVQRYVHDAPHAEIASRLGVSTDAVSMRLTRGKGTLRRLVAAELDPGPGWQETSVWCVDCGRTRLVLRRGDTLAVRCPSCQPGECERSVDLRLDNPGFARLVGDLVRPASILRRIGEWSARYFAAREDVECTRCGAPARLRVHRRDDTDRNDAQALGLVADCSHCEEQAWSSAAAIALAQPAVRAFRREHPRIRLAPTRQVDRALVVRYEDILGAAGVDVLLARDTLQVLSAHAA
jgi:RNA polymerase sigma factor (sigma-70 family)